MAKKTEPTTTLEREYTIPIREKCRSVASYRKTEKAIKTIKEFLAKHMKVVDRDINKVKLDTYLNEFMWQRGIKNPPHKIKVKASKDSEGIVRAGLVDYPDKLKFKKIRAERIEKAAAEVGKKKKAEKKEPEKTEEEKKEEGEKKEVEEEKKAAGIESGKGLEKAASKQMKHQVGGKTKAPKRPLRQALQK